MKVRTNPFDKRSQCRDSFWLRLALVLVLGQLAVTSAYASGTVLAWGSDNGGQCKVPAGLANVIAVAAGSTHSTALRSDGTVIAWGWNQFGQTNVPVGLTGVAAIGAGDLFSMALKRDGTVVCWGNAPVGTANVTNNVKAIAAGWDHCLAVKNDGTVVSWGSQTVVAPGLSNVLAVAAGNSNSLALKADGTVVAWGDNSYNKTNVPSTLKNVAAIAAGKDHCLAMKTDGTVIAWGRNNAGQTTVPSGLANVVAIAAGGYHSLALRADGSYVAWGDNSYGQTTINTNLTGLIAVAGGGYHSLGIQGDGAPVITVQPVSLTLAIGQTATFRPMAIGNQPLGFQWMKNGTNLPGATTLILSLGNIQMTDSGVYSFRVTNALGSLTSAGATLTVVTSPPWINTQPQNLAKQCGETATFTVAADGPPPLRYQWRYEGADLAGATRSSLILTGVTTTNVGTYDVIITNLYGSITSRLAQLSVVTIPTINSPPTDTNVFCGEACTLSVVATGPTPLTYQWLFNDAPILDATNSTLAFSPALLTNVGAYCVIVSCPCGAITSSVAQLSISVDPPSITSPLTVSAIQGEPFSYQITALHTPTEFGALYLPPNLTLDPATGLITGTNLESGDFGVYITAANVCASDSRWLAISVRSSAPGITSGLLVTGVEGQPLSYQITASNSPSSFGVTGLPPGLSLNAGSGWITGSPTYPGESEATIAAYNSWGVGTATLHFSISNAAISGLSIANITTNYYSPYLLEFQFTLRDSTNADSGDALTVDPAMLQIQCFENTNLVNPDPENGEAEISASETAQTVQRGNSKVMKTFLVLDFTASVADIGINGDTNGNNISDAVDLEVQGALDFVSQQPGNAQIGVYEFHRDDAAPQVVQTLTTDKALLKQKISGIWDNYVQGWPAGSRVWDATMAAVQAFTKPSVDEQHFVVLVSDGRDESSTTTFSALLKAASGTNNVHVYCVGFGPDLTQGRQNLLDLATATKGRYYDATNATQLASELARISKDLQGQYILRWATLRRGSKTFLPSFKITYQGQTAACPSDPVVTLSDTNYTGTNVDGTTPPFTTNNLDYFLSSTNWVITETNDVYSTNWTISPYTPDKYAGPVTNGTLYLTPNADVQPTGIDLSARYVPRYIRRLNLHYRANWPCTVSLQNTNSGEILHGWTMTETNDGAGGNWLYLSSSNPASLSSSIPFAAFGRLLTFTFRDTIYTNKSIFSFITNDNTIYTNTGKQSFVITNANQYSNSYPVLPMGTPVPWLVYYGATGNYTNAEISDVDKDGAPAWMEYRAGTNPTNVVDRFYIQSIDRSSYDYRYRIVFPSKVNHIYRVEASTNLVDWQTVQDAIPGTGNTISVSDTTLRLGTPEVFYRVLVY